MTANETLKDGEGEGDAPQAAPTLPAPSIPMLPIPTATADAIAKKAAD